MRRIALLTYHAIVDHDDMAMFNSVGYEVLNIGAFLNPRHPDDPMGEGETSPRASLRPPLDIDPPPDDVLKACRDTHAAKNHIPDEVFEWLGPDGVVISHHMVERTIFAQWPRLKQWGGRVIWRTCGQTSSQQEFTARQFRAMGMERVAYSPRERAMAAYAGADALIRFAMDPDVYNGWTGEDEAVINVTQDMAKRADATGYEFWKEATYGLNAIPMGPGSEDIGGPGRLDFPDLLAALRKNRAYLYTGTRWAPYTLGLLEAGMTGIPVVSIGPLAWGNEDLFEGCDLVPLGGYDDPRQANKALNWLLSNPKEAKQISEAQRAFFIENFGVQTIAAQWRDYLEGKS